MFCRLFYLYLPTNSSYIAIMLQILDIISPDGSRPRRIFGPLTEPHRARIDTIQTEVSDTVNGAADSINGATDSLNAVPDTLEQSASLVNNLGTGTGGSSSMMWTMLFVILALAICFYLVFAYRRRLQTGKR